MYLKHYLVPLLLITGFVGCSRLPSNDEDIYPIHGKWESSCTDTTEFVYGSNNLTIISKNTVLEFSASDVTRSVYEYDKASCQTENLRSTKTFIGHFDINTEQLDAEEDVIEIDITYLTLDITAHTEERKTAFESEFFNYDLTFPLDEAVDVSQTVHGENMRFYDIFQVEGDKLMFGDKSELDGLSSQNRPEIINAEVSFTKQ